MVPVFRRDAWEKWWEMLEPEWNFWGWGYDEMFKSVKKIKKMGIIDSQVVLHTKPVSSSHRKDVLTDWRKFHSKYKGYENARKINLRKLK
jgi:hypothetical protein